MKKLALPLLALLLSSGVTAQAQLGGLSIKKPSLGSSSSSTSSAGDIDKVIEQGIKILAFTTIGTEIGYRSSLKMLEAFPPEKVAHIKALSEKVNEAKKKRTKDGNMDASEVTAVSDFTAAIAKLEGNWKDYKKDKAKAVVPAYTGVGLMLGADAIAGTQVPEFLKAAQQTVSGAGADPSLLTKVRDLNALIVTLTVVSKQLPNQVQSGNTIRTIAKNIAQAENIKLGEAPKVESPDPAALKKQSASVEIEG